jgi:hypothetical protein
MKKALVFEGQILQIESVSFPVAPELIWIDVDDDVSVENHMLEGGVVVAKPKPALPTYQQLRAAAYPSIADQLDTIYHHGIDAWKLTITAVKDEIPK